MNSFLFSQVDGKDISNMKHMDAVNVLRATKQHVKLVVLRRPTGVSSKVSCFVCSPLCSCFKGICRPFPHKFLLA